MIADSELEVTFELSLLRPCWSK